MLFFFEKLGNGAYGAVFRGEYRSKQLAIKMIRTADEIDLDDSEYDDFVREGKIMLQLKSHPNLVNVMYLCVNRDFPAILMEYAVNGTLKDYLQSSVIPLEFNEKARLIKGIASGLSLLHKLGVVHRDVAARNILLGENQVPKLSDFGLSREMQVEGMYNSRGLHALPVKWMAPEAINGSFSTQSDIWSFGIVVWEIITKLSPHEQLEVTEAKIMIRDSHLSPVIPKDCEILFKDIMKQCWYPDPEMRILAADVVETVEDYLES
eukprot:TRINITY_DN2025_c0_g1_i1.p1 TRINITY_DN2025_c0_g1~~TRINITY_DN2025_c0_g1_i1.p1  ORF type:complete len:264 (+),score=48.19 TRINITY_DN2025_c0_g1_i1:155-946(+)